jgi:hypothetical protein
MAAYIALQGKPTLSVQSMKVLYANTQQGFKSELGCGPSMQLKLNVSTCKALFNAIKE